MSNIFRPQNEANVEGATRKIGIRNVFVKAEPNPAEELTLEEVLAQRDRLLDDASETISLEKQGIENMRKVALEDIAAMKKAWEEEKLQLQQQAYDEAFQAGHEEGRNTAISHISESMKQANEVTEKSHENATQYLVGQERVILELGMRVAERIIGQTIKDDEEVFLSVVRRALKEAREMKEIKLYVSLDHFNLVSENRAELASIFPPDVPFLIFVNEDFDSTECYIETNHGRIVVSIEEQLNEVRERLVEIMESGDSR